MSTVTGLSLLEVGILLAHNGSESLNQLEPVSLFQTLFYHAHTHTHTLLHQSLSNTNKTGQGYKYSVCLQQPIPCQDDEHVA